LQQKLQPLIWLARKCTSMWVTGGTPPVCEDFPNASMACMASGRT